MARKKITATRGIAEGGAIYTHYDNNVIGRVIAAGIAKAAPHLAPWIAGGGMIPVAAATHGMWGTAEALPWASAALALSGAGLTAVTWTISRYRHTLGRLQSTGTTAV